MADTTQETSTPDRIKELRQTVDRLRRQYDRAVGELDTLKARLKTVYDVQDVAEAKIRLKEIRKKIDNLKQDREFLLEAFENNYAVLLAQE